MVFSHSTACARAEQWSAAAPMAVGLASIIVLVMGLGLWSTFASVSGAVVAQGKIKVASERQIVQHPEGGVVVELKVREGDVVGAGDVLLRLDASRHRAELAIVQNQLFENLARISRLEAEQDLGEELRFPNELVEHAERDAEVGARMEGQQRLFDARRERVRRETEQLGERQRQIRDEIAGMRAQHASIQRQRELIENELNNQKVLFEKGLTQSSRVLTLEQEYVRLGGELGALSSRMAEAEGRITEIDVQLTSLAASRVEEAVAELRDLRTKEAELRERRLELLDAIDRLEIRAPRDGVVIDLAVFALRAVVSPAEPILYVVPSEDDLVVEARIDAKDIDQVFPGQAARLRFAALNQRTTPEIRAHVRRVTPDVLVDERTGTSYYAAELAVSDGDWDPLGLVPVPGMPVDAFIQTGMRSPISYLIRPLHDVLARSFKEP